MTQSSSNDAKPSLLQNRSFVVETIYLVGIVLLTAVIFFDYVNTGFFWGPLRFSHWMGIVGSIFLLVFAPGFYFLKRKFPKHYKTLMNIHVFGFTTAFLLVSIHLAGQLSRPLQFYPDLGAGVALYIIVLFLVVTGYMFRYFPLTSQKRKRFPHFNRWLHVSLISGMYIVIIVHMFLNFFLI
jgi:hypothetical protein